MSLKADLKPKYRIAAKQDGRPMPLHLDYRDLKEEVLSSSASMAKSHPACTIEVSLQKGFSHGKAMKWRYEPKDNELLVLAKFDKTQGTPVFDEMTGADEKLKRVRH